MPDKEKLLVIAREIQLIYFPEMATSKGIKIAGDVAEMLIKAADHIKEKCAEL